MTSQRLSLENYNYFVASLAWVTYCSFSAQTHKRQSILKKKKLALNPYVSVDISIHNYNHEKKCCHTLPDLRGRLTPIPHTMLIRVKLSEATARFLNIKDMCGEGL